MLMLKRKPGQIVCIGPDPGIDPQTPIGELFKNGSIEIKVVGYRGAEVRIGVEAPPAFLVLRKELTAQNGPLQPA
jgi:sRNA-binding carbon storage regulator CsrA